GLKADPGAITSHPAQLIDVMPTILDVSGANYPAQFKERPIQALEGTSFAGKLHDEPSKPAQWMFWEHAGHAAVRHGDLKALLPRREKQWQLYDLLHDRQETLDLASEQPGMVAEMAATWKEWADRVGVTQAKAKEPVAKSTTTTRVGSPKIANCELEISVTVEANVPVGVAVAQGGDRYGYAVHFLDGKPAFDVRIAGQVTRLTSDQRVAGQIDLVATLTKETMALSVGEEQAYSCQSPGLIPIDPIDALSIGHDSRTAAGDYQAPNRFDGKVLSHNVKATAIKTANDTTVKNASVNRWNEEVAAAEGTLKSAPKPHSKPFAGQRPNRNQTQLLESNFWYSRLQTNHEVTVWHALEQCEQTGRINNFRIAAGEAEGIYRGLRFDDSDFYKVIEGASRVLAIHPDPRLDAALDKLIETVGSAQQPDGYLYTVMQIAHDPNNPVKGVVPGQPWLHERESHETYCMGHLIEAGIAHYQATGKRSLLDVAINAANCLVHNFGPGKVELPSGHQEVEIALVRLSQVTGDDRYLRLAEFFLDQRGRTSPDRSHTWSAYFQDHVPVREQTEAVGHAVRAAYQYMAMADVAVATGDEEYVSVLKGLWENVAAKKLYLTGGIGGGSGEGFSSEYQLPNLRAYNETCSSIANILWQHRMHGIDPNGKYIDIAERCLFNSFLSGVSIEGNKFFYPNKLTSVSGHYRAPWFKCACCPPNVLRFLPQIPSLFYSAEEDRVLVNHFGSSKTSVGLPSGKVRLTQTSDYPWNGKVKIDIETESDRGNEFIIAIRRPGWLSRPFPSDLYRYDDDEGVAGGQSGFLLRINEKVVQSDLMDGYDHLTRKWESGDTIEFEFPMPVRRVVANERVAACRDQVAIMRGPIVYAGEGIDNDGEVHSLMIPRDVEFTPSRRDDLLNGLVTLTANVHSVGKEKDEFVTRGHRITMIPYFGWAHRGMSPMRVWFADKPEAAWPTTSDAIYTQAKLTTSGRNPWTHVGAVNDQVLPRSSDDGEVLRFMWDKTDTAPVGAGELETLDANTQLASGVRWIQYDCTEPTPVNRVSIFWATGDHGRCALPQSFRVLYRSEERWFSVTDKETTAKGNELQTVTFDPVNTKSLRLEVVPPAGKTSGILEWSFQ
ncbi:MAG: beta-L-arabinofuranosidase domain-containing protein, partial [Planctomycetota bacterium]